MPKRFLESLMHGDRSTTLADTGLAPGAGTGLVVAAQALLGAARAVGSIDAERVHQALIDLIQAALDASEADGTTLQNGNFTQAGR